MVYYFLHTNSLVQRRLVIIRQLSTIDKKNQHDFPRSLEEQKYKSLYEGSPILYRTINLDGIIIDCNQAYADALMYSKDEIIGKAIFDHTADNDLEKIRESFKNWRRAGTVKNKEIWLKRKDGTIFPTLLSATSYHDENGNLVGSNTVITDITELYEVRKKLQQKELQVENQLEELQRLQKSKNEFITIVTHELKTPLVPIKGYIDLLLLEKFGPLNDAQKERMAIVKQSIQVLLRLVSDLLDTQKIELRQLKLNKDRHNLVEIISLIVETVKEDANKNEITITKNVPKTCICLCDRTRLEQVFTNVISNSLDFCPKGTGVIDISLTNEGNQAKLTISDNGMGIEKEKLGNLFVKFYQADSTASREHGGSGLGLAVCKGVIESHGGKIWAESDGRGKGMKIHILLPME